MTYIPVAQGLPLDGVDEVELLSIPGCSVRDAGPWPDPLSDLVDQRCSLDGPEAKEVLRWVKSLPVSISARCHDPRFGLTFRRRGDPVVVIALCYRCSNATVFGVEDIPGIRTFDPSSDPAQKLRSVFVRHFTP